MTIRLIGKSRELVLEWQKQMATKPYVEIQEGDIFQIDSEALISPGNSYGFMDGGLDYYITEKYGVGIQEELKHRIKTIHHGELLVGRAEIIPTQNQSTKYIVCAPTMRVPKSLEYSMNAYLATKAVLLAVRDFPVEIKSISFPGMGTGIGKIPLDLAALQMRVAIEEVIEGKDLFPSDFAEAQTLERYLSIPHYNQLYRTYQSEILDKIRLTSSPLA